MSPHWLLHVVVRQDGLDPAGDGTQRRRHAVLDETARWLRPVAQAATVAAIARWEAQLVAADRIEPGDRGFVSPQRTPRGRQRGEGTPPPPGAGRTPVVQLDAPVGGGG